MDLVKSYFDACDSAYETWKAYSTLYFQQMKPYLDASLRK